MLSAASIFDVIPQPQPLDSATVAARFDIHRIRAALRLEYGHQHRRNFRHHRQWCGRFISPYSVTVTAEDSSADISTNETFTWDVDDLVLRNPGLQGNLVGDAASLTIAAPYSGSGTLAFSATGLPSGLAIDGGTGVISGTAASGDEHGQPLHRNGCRHRAAH